MTHRIYACALIVLAAVAAGCRPEARVRWSPDGKTAAVLAPDGLYLADAEGKLSARIAEGVKAAEWTPDSKRLVVIRHTELPTWKEARAFLDEAQARKIVAGGKRLKEEFLAHQGPMDQFEPSCAADVSPQQITLMLLYIRDEEPAGLAEKLGDKWEEYKKAAVPVLLLEVGDVAGGKVAFAPPVVRTLNVLAGLRLSPDGKVAACTGEPAMVKSPDPALWVVPVAGGELRAVADRVSALPDWSPNGRSLVYARAASPRAEGKEALRLGTISRREVAGADGALLEIFPDAGDLAGLLFHDRLKVRCLADGRVLFDTMAVQLPCTADELPQPLELFALDMDLPVAAKRILSAAAREKAGNITWFEVSPDGKRILLQTPVGVAIASLADGGLVAEIAENQESLMNLPVWRTADEVCLAVKPESKLGSSARPEVVLWSAKGSKVLSKSWPDDMVKGMLLPPKATPETPAEGAAPAKPEEKKPEEAKPATK